MAHPDSLFAPAAALPDTADFLGTWFVSDDGWPGRLTLFQDADTIEGSFFSERFRESYRVTARVDTADPRSIEFVIHGYNWLDQQVYTGVLFDFGRTAMTGASVWRGVPFGFVAWRAQRPALSVFRSGTVNPSDFGGVWVVRLDGHSANLALEYQSRSRTLRGECWGRSFGPYTVEGEPGTQVPHEVSLTLTTRSPTGAPPARLKGYLFSRPKNMVSGWARIGDQRRAFYLVRCR